MFSAIFNRYGFQTKKTAKLNHLHLTIEVSIIYVIKSCLRNHCCLSEAIISQLAPTSEIHC
jgi:hypothetical protein